MSLSHKPLTSEKRFHFEDDASHSSYREMVCSPVKEVEDSSPPGRPRPTSPHSADTRERPVNHQDPHPTRTAKQCLGWSRKQRACLLGLAAMVRTLPAASWAWYDWFLSVVRDRISPWQDEDLWRKVCWFPLCTRASQSNDCSIDRRLVRIHSTVSHRRHKKIGNVHVERSSSGTNYVSPAEDENGSRTEQNQKCGHRDAHCYWRISSRYGKMPPALLYFPTLNYRERRVHCHDHSWVVDVLLFGWDRPLRPAGLELLLSKLQYHCVRNRSAHVVFTYSSSWGVQSLLQFFRINGIEHRWASSSSW